jgi:Domain of unknown function (DUF6265)
MKTTLLQLFLMIAISDSIGQEIAKQARDDFKKLTWLEGTWQRTNNRAGQTGIERWVKASPFELQGYGVTYRGADTLFVEKLRIVINEDRIYYVADVPENQQPVYFKLTDITKTSFVFENADHDFPKKIVYQAENDVLKATVSGSNKSLEYLFRRQ